MLYSTLPGVVIGGLRIDECQAWEEDPASCVARDARQNWEVGRCLQSREGMRIEISPKSTHGCPNTIFLRF
jgi:hypothetical protein